MAVNLMPGLFASQGFHKSLWKAGDIGMVEYFTQIKNYTDLVKSNSISFWETVNKGIPIIFIHLPWQSS
jgi:hypothetical protein